jgi:hypothetical protein
VIATVLSLRMKLMRREYGPWPSSFL